MIGFFLQRGIAFQKTDFNQMRQMKYRSFVKLGTVSTNRILSLFYFNNFNVMLAFFINISTKLSNYIHAILKKWRIILLTMQCDFP